MRGIGNHFSSTKKRANILALGLGTDIEWHLVGLFCLIRFNLAGTKANHGTLAKKLIYLQESYLSSLPPGIFETVVG